MQRFRTPPHVIGASSVVGRQCFLPFCGREVLPDLLAGHTVQLVEDITGLAGVNEMTLTLREEAPIRVTRAQVRMRLMQVHNNCT